MAHQLLGARARSLVVALILAASATPTLASGRVASAVSWPSVLDLARYAPPTAVGGKRCASYSKQRLYADYYVDAASSWNIMALPADAGTAATPLCQITYDGMRIVGGIADDATGKLWVVVGNLASIVTFPHGQNGAAPPTQVIQGSDTLIVGLDADYAQNISFDASGNVWVPCWYGYNGFTGYVVAFANSANGNVAPLATIGYHDKGQSESIAAPVATAFDHEGNLYVAEYTIPGKIVVFSPPFEDTSKPVATWTLPPKTGAQHLTVDQDDDIIVGSSGSYYVFENGLKSNGVISRSIALPFGAYDVKALPKGNVYDSTIYGTPNGEISIAVVSPHAKRYYDHVRYITSSYFQYGSLGALALGQ